MSMEKYSVVTEKQDAKLASNGCPICGSALTKTAGVILCPIHGSEPFENERYGEEESRRSPKP